jgi:sugar O-acyltransferase (sialic acid O-acetyltransferase NeuD family)
MVVLDNAVSRHGQKVLEVPVVGGDDLLPELAGRGFTHFVVGIGSIQSTGPRERLFDTGLRHGLQPLIVRHPTAICSGTIRAGAGAQMLAGSIINTGAHLGVNTVVNTGAIVEHHCIIDDHSHIASRVTLAGEVHVGRGAHIGAGATVRQGIRIGEGAIVGAGSVVVKDVPAGMTVVGVPARILYKGAA